MLVAGVDGRAGQERDVAFSTRRGLGCFLQEVGEPPWGSNLIVFVHVALLS